jgi:ASF1 like histone chaperone
MSIVNVSVAFVALFLEADCLKVLSIAIPENPAKFGEPYVFDITFECLEPLSKGVYFPPPRDPNRSEANLS